MNTRVPKIAPPEVKNNEKPGWVTEIRKYKVITPLYGGGEETQKTDSVTTVRASEVRGHLRFWWRATRGGAFNGDLKKMREAEENIWGGVGEKKSSNIYVTITDAQPGVTDRPFEVVSGKTGKPLIRSRNGSQVHPYAAFPLQPEQKEARIGMDTKSVAIGISFTMEIRYLSDYKKDVEAALWAWENLGGIGARTRRGFGAVQCEAVNGKSLPPPASSEVKKLLISNIQHHVEGSSVWPSGVPYLSTNAKHYKVVEKKSNPISTWYDLIETFKKFRQSRRVGENEKTPGRSYWPEPEKIRELTAQRLPKHQPLEEQVGKFPRAKFGLPIIFHFKDTNRNKPADSGSDPRDTTLQGRNNDRLASPLILRPIACNGGTAGVAAILEWEPLESAGEKYTPPGGLILKDAPNDPEVANSIRGDEVNDIRPLRGNPDVLQAFLDYLK